MIVLTSMHNGQQAILSSLLDRIQEQVADIQYAYDNFKGEVIWQLLSTQQIDLY